MKAWAVMHSGAFLQKFYTYLFTPWCRVLPEQLTGLQLVKKFPAFHGTRKIITALTQKFNTENILLTYLVALQISGFSHGDGGKYLTIMAKRFRE